MAKVRESSTDLRRKMSTALERIEQGLSDPEFTPADRQEIANKLGETADELEAMLHTKLKMENQNATKRTAKSVLAEIFSQSPLPNRLKVPKQQWLAGKLKETGQARIIREFSDYTPRLVCEVTSTNES